jgi:fumarylacetoacetase
MNLDFTHDPSLRCTITSAHADKADFTIQNLPFGSFRRRGSAESFRGGVAIGDQIICLGSAHANGCFDGLAAQAALAAAQPELNDFLALGPMVWRALRHALVRLLDANQPLAGVQGLLRALVPQSEAEYAVPVGIGNYTDFYTSIYHARNTTQLRNPPGQIAPNFVWMPIAYHGRASSIGISGQAVRRPWGQVMPAGLSAPRYQVCELLDYELELGIVVGQPNPQGDPVSLSAAANHVFGITLLNDWSARDIQGWEMTPLGPFLAKNFATTLSPWIVTMDALAPYRTAMPDFPDRPAPLAYLDDATNRSHGAFDIKLEAWLQPTGHAPSRLSHTSFRHQYWTIAQMIAHHTVGGCNLEVGDVLGSGTVSGPTPSECGAMIELSKRGREPVTLANGGGQRSFLEDGDTLILRGWCEAPDRARVGFGEACGTIVPAHA